MKVIRQRPADDLDLFSLGNRFPVRSVVATFDAQVESEMQLFTAQIALFGRAAERFGLETAGSADELVQ